MRRTRSTISAMIPHLRPCAASGQGQQWPASVPERGGSLSCPRDDRPHGRDAGPVDPSAAAMRPGGRPDVHRQLSAGRGHPGRLPAPAPSGQLAGPRPAGLGPDRQLHHHGDVVPGRRGRTLASRPDRTVTGRRRRTKAGRPFRGQHPRRARPHRHGRPRPAQRGRLPHRPGQRLPTGDAPAPPSPRRTGTVHNLAAIPFFAGLPAAALVSGRRSWANRPARIRLLQRGHRSDHADHRGAVRGTASVSPPAWSPWPACSSGSASSPAWPGSPPCWPGSCATRPPPPGTDRCACPGPMARRPRSG